MHRHRVTRTCRLATHLALAAAATLAQNSKPSPVFDVASVKMVEKGRSYPGALQMKGGPGTSDPGHLTWGITNLSSLVWQAWGVQQYQIVMPDSADLRQPYEIAATMPPTTTGQQFHLMFQNLLIERFQLRLHHETRKYPGYELIVAQGGLKVQHSADSDEPDPVGSMETKLDAGGFLVLRPGRGQGISIGRDGVHLKLQNYTMADFASSEHLGFYLKQPDGSSSHIVDKTGLTGKYDFALRFDPRVPAAQTVVGPQVRASAPSDRESGTGAPDIFQAMQKQLGLKLVKTKGVMLDTIVIDHAEKVPTPN